MTWTKNEAEVIDDLLLAYGSVLRLDNESKMKIIRVADAFHSKAFEVSGAWGELITREIL